MSWYDVFSSFYDNSLEELYRDARSLTCEALDLAPGQVVLDVPCGTGQSFDGIVSKIAPNGVLVGADLSDGMLSRASARVAKNGWSNVHTLKASVLEIEDKDVTALTAGAPIDRIQVFLGMSAFPQWETAFDRLWSMLRPGGRFVIVDVYAETLSFQGWMVNLVARAEIRRRCWEPLERVSQNFERRDLPKKREHGGQIYLATGVKPPLT